MVRTIQQMQVANPLMEVPFTTKGEWNISQVRIPNSKVLEETSKPQ